MRRLLAILLLLVVANLAAEEFTTKDAKKAQETFDEAVQDARKEYDQAVDRARKEFVKDLRAAAKSPAQKGELEEVSRINDTIKRIEAADTAEGLDPVTVARDKVAGTTWQWGPHTIHLTNDGTARVSNGRVGQWAMVSDTECVVKVREGALWIFKFDADYKQNASYPYDESKTEKPANGRRIK